MGNSCRDILHSHPSPQLQSLRRARRNDIGCGKAENFELIVNFSNVRRDPGNLNNYD